MNKCLNRESKKIIEMLDSLEIDVPYNDKLKPLYTQFIAEYKKIPREGVVIETKKIKVHNLLPNILEYIRNSPQIQTKYGINNHSQIVQFLNRCHKMTLQTMGEWLDGEGILLKRVMNRCIMDNALSPKIMENIIDDNLYSEYSSLDILASIEKITKQTTIRLDNVHIVVYYNGSLKKDINTIIKRCLILSKVHKLKEPIVIKLWLTPAKKKASNNIILGSREVNSGLTSFTLINRESTILRKEEYKKLIIHELIHYLDLDFKKKLYFNFSRHFNISPKIDIILYESYTEVSACIINAILSSFECNNRQNYSIFKKFIVYETKFCLFQIAKILLLYGFKDVADFTRPYDSRDRFRQTTHVFSYYFIKGALLYNIGKMLKFYTTHCNTIKFKRVKMTYDAYIALIMSCCLDKQFLKKIDYLMRAIKEDKILYSFNSMRMTCIEI